MRAGAHCAMPLLKCFGLLATCRVSLGLYNTREEIDVLCVSLSGRGNCSRHLASVHVARQLALSSAASDRTRHHHRSKRASVGKYRSIGKPVPASRPCCRLSSIAEHCNRA
ncbi:aminotransferase class V-fold PLP-dependent enzyme [Bradyrhizobium ottawaense]|uniref:aminotransferase class V-fold PLP-dependent enzyme n=1 Tax=Bradyrhizobium ottawaense TaxID=931866 RepID=UPI0035171B2A